MELPMQGLTPQTLAQINQVGPFGTGDRTRSQSLVSLIQQSLISLKWVKIRIMSNLRLLKKAVTYQLLDLIKAF